MARACLLYKEVELIWKTSEHCLGSNQIKKTVTVCQQLACVIVARFPAHRILAIFPMNKCGSH